MGRGVVIEKNMTVDSKRDLLSLLVAFNDGRKND